MAPAKLSPADKKALIERFRTTTAPIAALAEQFGVSVSTVSRILRGSFPPKEYEQLREQRSRLTEDAEPQVAAVEPEPTATIQQPVAEPSVEAIATVVAASSVAPEAAAIAPDSTSFSGRRRRRRTTAEVDATDQQLELTAPVTNPEPENAALEQEPEAIAKPILSTDKPRPVLKSAVVEAAPVVAPESNETETVAEVATSAIKDAEAAELELTAEDLRGGGTAIEDADEFGDDDETEDEELAFSDDDLRAEDDDELTETTATLELLPLGIAPLPRTSYVVVDRTADLVTCSLTTLTELGTVEADHAETQALPLFDNPRTAKRFCKRNQRVIKVPDSQLLLKTTRWLQAKGIHCLLIDGQVYALDR